MQLHNHSKDEYGYVYCYLMLYRFIYGHSLSSYGTVTVLAVLTVTVTVLWTGLTAGRHSAIGIINFEKLFSKFYRRHYEFVSKFKVGLKSLLQQGQSELEFYSDLVYKLRKIVSRADFSYQFRNVIMRYKRFGCNINVMRQSAWLVINSITVDSFASLFNWPCIRLNDGPKHKAS